jgi:hypothetical protein
VTKVFLTVAIAEMAITILLFIRLTAGPTISDGSWP